MVTLQSPLPKSLRDFDLPSRGRLVGLWGGWRIPDANAYASSFASSARNGAARSSRFSAIATLAARKPSLVPQS